MPIDEFFSDLMATDETYAFLTLILKHFASITIYTIEPYITQNDEVLMLPAGENYSIHDYGGRLVIAPVDIYAVDFFSSVGLLNATAQALAMLVDAGVKEIAVLGDERAKKYISHILMEDETLGLKLINYHPPESFGLLRDAVKRYLEDKGLKLKKLRERLEQKPART